jgi:hypothetical protein
MLIGSSTSHKLQVVTSAAADIEAAASVIAVSTATPPVVDGSALLPILPASITSATTTDLVPGAPSLIKRVMECSLRNNHGSTTCDVTIQRTDGTNTDTVVKATLLAGEALVYTNAGAWLHYDINGAIYPSVGNAATQAEMEAGTALDKYVPPGRVQYHPGVCKCWGKANGAGTSLIANYNVTSITDTGTGQLTVNIGTDFSSADYSITTSLERVATSLAVANVDNGGLIRNATQAVGAFQIENYDDTATTHVAQDPSSYYWQCFGDQA